MVQVATREGARVRESIIEVRGGYDTRVKEDAGYRMNAYGKGSASRQMLSGARGVGWCYP